MTIKSAALLNSYPATLPDFTKHEYRAPPKDRTIVKCQVVRACWVTLREGEPMRTVKPGEVLTVQRWIADELARNGKASLL